MFLVTVFPISRNMITAIKAAISKPIREAKPLCIFLVYYLKELDGILRSFRWFFYYFYFIQ